MYKRRGQSSFIGIKKAAARNRATALLLHIYYIKE